MIFERINTAVRKTIVYFGCLYAVYLAENHPYSWENLIDREDLIDILMIIHYHCQEQMQLYLEIVGKDKLNKHKMSELARMIRFAVNDDYDTILYGGYDPTIVSSRVLEDDEITIYGTSVGLFSFLHALEPLRFYRAIERPDGARHGGHRVVA